MAKFLGESGLQELISLLKQDLSSIVIDLFVICEELPEKGETNKIYLVPAEQTEEENIFVEWIWVNNAWEKLGEVKIDTDLSGYVKAVDTEATAPLQLEAYVDGNTLHIIGSVAEATTTSAGTMSAADKAKLDNIDLSGYVDDVDVTGVSAPLVIGATITDGVLVVSGSINPSSATSAGTMSAEQYTQLESLVENPLQYAEEISAADVDTIWDEVES